MEELTYAQAFEKCRDHRLNVINDRFLTIPDKIMKLDELFDDYCDDLRTIRKRKEEEIKKRKEELERKKKEEENKKNGIPQRFYWKEINGQGKD